MKVCTDACLFGAWVVHHTAMDNAKQILDIGTGTGLLALMLAQFSKAKIDAVELNKMAAEQAEDNFKASPWKEQLNIYHTSIISFTRVEEKKYDLIISNPPFFENQLKSYDQDRNIAMHSNDLSLTELAKCISGLLNNTGRAAVLLPSNRIDEWKKIIQEVGLFCIHETSVKQTPHHSIFRTMLIMDKSSKPSIQDEIIIKVDNNYSTAFRQLLTPYYLAF